MKKFHVVPFIFALVGMGLATGLLASPPPQKIPAIVDTVNITVVNIEVFVTDERGIPVNGLTAADFEVFEGGRPMRVSNFYAVNPAVINDNAAVKAVDREDAGKELQLAIVVDEFNTSAFHLIHAYRELIAFVEQGRTGDAAVMVGSFTGRFNIEQAFTKDRQAILDTLGRMAARGIRYFHCDDRLACSIKTMESLRSTVTTLAGLPGRKAILYVSQGFDLDIGRRTFEFNEAYPGSYGMGGWRHLLDLASYTNASGVTVYCVDPTGGGRPVLSSARAPLDSLSYITGGKLIYNRNSFITDLTQLAQDFNSYYSLGYTPDDTSATKHRDIVVRVNKPHMKVRYRHSFRMKPVSERMKEQTVTALLQGIPSQPESFIVEVDETPIKRRGLNFLVPLRLLIPLDRVQLTPGQDGQTGRVDVSMAAIDPKNRTSPAQIVTIDIVVTPDQVGQAKTVYYSYPLTVLLRSGENKVQFVVRDTMTAETTSFSTTLKIGPERAVLADSSPMR